MARSQGMGGIPYHWEEIAILPTGETSPETSPLQVLVASTRPRRGNLFKYYPEWKQLQKILWVTVREETIVGKGPTSGAARRFWIFSPQPVWRGESRPLLGEASRAKRLSR